MPRLASVAIAVFGSFGAACTLAFPVGDFEGEAGQRDAGVALRDGGVRDASARDAGSVDAARPDATPRDGGEVDAGEVDAGVRDGGPLCERDANRIFCASFDRDPDVMTEWGGGEGTNDQVTLVRDTKSPFSPPAAMRADAVAQTTPDVAGSVVLARLTEPDPYRRYRFRYRLLTAVPPTTRLPILAVRAFPPVGPEVTVDFFEGQVRVLEDATVVLSAPLALDGDWHRLELSFGPIVTGIHHDGSLLTNGPWRAPFAFDDTEFALGIVSLSGTWPPLSILFDDVEVTR